MSQKTDLKPDFPLYSIIHSTYFPKKRPWQAGHLCVHRCKNRLLGRMPQAPKTSLRSDLRIAGVDAFQKSCPPEKSPKRKNRETSPP